MVVYSLVYQTQLNDLMLKEQNKADAAVSESEEVSADQGSCQQMHLLHFFAITA